MFCRFKSVEIISEARVRLWPVGPKLAHGLFGLTLIIFYSFLALL